LFDEIPEFRLAHFGVKLSDGGLTNPMQLSQDLHNIAEITVAPAVNNHYSVDMYKTKSWAFHNLECPAIVRPIDPSMYEYYRI
jgi:hypothetical protein